MAKHDDDAIVLIGTILGKHDFQHLIRNGCPDYEYFPEAEQLVPWLQRCPDATAENVTTELHHIFSQTFDPVDAGQPEQYSTAAQEILTTWRAPKR